MPTPHEIADSLEPDLRAAFIAMVEAVAQAVPDSQLQALLEAGDIVGIVDAFEAIVARSLTFSTTTELTSIYGALISQPLANTLRAAGLSASFNLVSQLVIDRIKTEAGALVVGVGKDSIASIRTILEQGYTDGIGAPAAGRLIRSVVGLLPSHATAVARYADSLKERGVPPEPRTHFVTQYAQRLLNLRAETISRTETIRASIAGQMTAWLRMAEEGILQRHRTRVVWVVTEDDRLCPWCAPMDNVEVSLGELFQSTVKGFPDGKPDIVTPGSERLRRGPIKPDPRSQPRDAQGRFLPFFKRDRNDHLDGKLVRLRNPTVVPHPPLHPNCRCALKLRFID